MPNHHLVFYLDTAQRVWQQSLGSAWVWGPSPPSSPSVLAGHCAGLPGASAVLQHGCALDEGSADSSSWVQYRNIFLKLKRKGSGLEGMNRWCMARQELSTEGRELVGRRQKQTQVLEWLFLCAPLPEVGTRDLHKEQINFFIHSCLNSSGHLKRNKNQEHK